MGTIILQTNRCHVLPRRVHVLAKFSFLFDIIGEISLAVKLKPLVPLVVPFGYFSSSEIEP